MTSRRAFLAALPAAGAAAALPLAVAANDKLSAAGLPESVAAKVERLMMELSDALSEYMGGQFRAIVEPASAPNCVVILNNMAAPMRSLQRRRNQALGTVNVEGRSVIFDPSLAPAVTRVEHEDTALTAHCSAPEPGAEYLVLDEWGKLQVTRLEAHADYSRAVAHPRLAFRESRSTLGRPYLTPVLVIGKVLERQDLRA